MSLEKLLTSQLAQNEKMLGKVVEDLEDADLDFRPVPTAMSFREHLEHLCAACEAVLAIRERKAYSWESFTAQGQTFDSLLSQYRGLRLKLTPLLKEVTPEIAELLSDYLVLHESYHIGQLCLTRRARYPDWDTLAIYH